MQDYLDEISHEFGNKGSFARTKLVLSKLGIKDFCYDIVHVAGTNGKGSVCVKIAKGLSYGLKKVALFSSPHISCFTERIQINLIPIDKALAFKLLKKIRAVAVSCQTELCFFDCMCVLAFYYFTIAKVDIAVIEVGVGGRFDQTNIVTPILTIITSIALDHQEMLGQTVEEIATHKAGILKESIPVILGFSSQIKPILCEANKRKCNTICISEQKKPDLENWLIAKSALEFLRVKYNLNRSVFKGLSETMTCRFELVNARYLLDIAHNQAALESLFYKIKIRFPTKSIYTVISMCSHKNLKQCLECVDKSSDQVFVFHPFSKKLASRQMMLKYLPRAKACESVFQALELASNQPGIVLCCASAYFMKEVKEFLDLQKPYRARHHLDKQSS